MNDTSLEDQTVFVTILATIDTVTNSDSKVEIEFYRNNEETVVYESDPPTFNGDLEDAPKIPCLSDKLAKRKWQFVTPKAIDDDSDKIEIFLDCVLIGGVFVFTVADNMMTLTLNSYVTFAPPGQHTCEIHL